MVKLEMDYALDVDKENEEVAFKQLDESLSEEFGPKFKLIRIIKLTGPAGGWPTLLVGFDGSLDECKDFFESKGLMAEDEIEEMVIDKDN